MQTLLKVTCRKDCLICQYSHSSRHVVFINIRHNLPTKCKRTLDSFSAKLCVIMVEDILLRCIKIAYNTQTKINQIAVILNCDRKITTFGNIITLFHWVSNEHTALGYHIYGDPCVPNPSTTHYCCKTTLKVTYQSAGNMVEWLNNSSVSHVCKRNVIGSYGEKPAANTFCLIAL